ncbi:MAG: ATP-binding cassette domain-containing protein [Alphaproteobacteria bacterium]|nr:ATP-binding cassette domain-containing protein [Alphaproteobacteria bacterium]
MSESPRPSSRRVGQLQALWPWLAPYGGRVLGALLALVVAAASVLTIGIAMRRIVDHGFRGEDGAFIDLYFLALFGIIAVLAIATFTRFYLVTWLGERIVADLRLAIHRRVLAMSPTFFETTKVGEVLSRLTADTTLIQTVIGSSASVALRNLLTFAGATVLLAITSPRLAMLIAVVIPLVVAPIVLLGRRVRSLSRESQDRVADVSARAAETYGAIQTVQAFGHEAIELRGFAQRVEGAFGAALRRVGARAWLTALVMLLVFGAVDFVLWSGGHDVFSGRMTGGELAAFVFYAVLAAGSLGALSEVWGDLQRAAGAAERILELLALEPAIACPADPLPMPTPAKGAIEIADLTFRYPSRPDEPALSDFALRVRPGETVALVGPSGAGKSTVFQLLLRFYDPERGTIRLDGVDLRRADPAALRARFALVPQEPVIFAGSVADNIRYGRPEADDAQVRAAAEQAGAAEFVARLPEGYDSQLGERGLRLSGGQKQRLAIARAMLRDPAVLLLDEATSALDAESERLVQQGIETLMRGRTTLVIAHRLATVLRAGRIVVLERGRIVAEGDHAALMRQDGLYARLARLQFDLGREAAAS